MRVLLPLDGSELAEIVLDSAKGLVGKMPLELILLHVCKPSEIDAMPIHKAYIQQHVDGLLRDVKDVGKRSGSGKETRKIKARGEVISGNPAEEIIRYAVGNKADMIIMATHGSSGVKHWAMGSVVEKVLRVSNAPVWLVRSKKPRGGADGKSAKLKMIVPLDGSRLAESVLPYVTIAAKHRGADSVDVALVRVCEPPAITCEYAGLGFPMSRQDVIQHEVDYSKKTAQKYLGIVKTKFEDSGIAVQENILVGHPAEEIAKFAKKEPSGLIVISTHGHSGIGRWAYGSFGTVAQRLLHDGTSPVLRVRPR